MASPRDAKAQERVAARRAPPAAVDRTRLPEPLAMLRRRGLDPRPSRPDLPFDPKGPPERLDALADRLGSYAFRLFLRGAILRRGAFRPEEASRYVPLAKAREHAESCVALGLAERRPRGAYRLLHPARSFGGVLEWWLARELSQRLCCETAHGVRSGAPGVGGDFDVVAAFEGKLLYVEAKSSPPKHLTAEEVAAFLRRVDALRPDLSLFVVDTALRLSDKVLPLFDEAFTRLDAPPPRPTRLFRETWALGPGLTLVNAKEDLLENVCRAVAEGLRSLAPPVVTGAPAPPPAAPSRRSPRRPSPRPSPRAPARRSRPSPS